MLEKSRIIYRGSARRTARLGCLCLSQPRSATYKPFIFPHWARRLHRIMVLEHDIRASFAVVGTNYAAACLGHQSAYRLTVRQHVLVHRLVVSYTTGGVYSLPLAPLTPRPLLLHRPCHHVTVGRFRARRRSSARCHVSHLLPTFQLSPT